MITEYTQFLIMLFLFHWVTDFFLQDDDVALKKCSDNRILFFHCVVYSFPISLLFLIAGWKGALVSFVVLFVSHFVIDYVTSRLNRKFWTYGHRHKFFTMVGFDQFLHQAILLLLAMYFWRYNIVV